eukprot:12352341-Ditylum_brightwellii.AAC.1
MSLSALHGSFKFLDAEHGKVHEEPVILFGSVKESTVGLDKVEITLRISLNAMGGGAKNYVTKNRITKFKMGNL